MGLITYINGTYKGLFQISVNALIRAYPLAPVASLGQDLILIQGQRSPIFKQLPAGHPDVAHLFPGAGVDQLRLRVVDRLGLGLAQVHRNQVGGLSRLQGAGLPVDTQRLGAVDGSHAQGGAGGPSG